MTRRAFEARGHDVISCDLLPADDDGRHIIGDVFETLKKLRHAGWWPRLAIFHPTCTYLTCSAEWAYGDGPYHQKVKPGTLVGAARRQARENAIADVLRIDSLPIEFKAVENPIGVLSSRWRKPDQIIQPFQFGDDASKRTGLHLTNLPQLEIDPALRCPGRMVNGVERWSNQTDSGQSNVGPSETRWKDRSKTYPGISNAFALNWG